MDAIASIFDLEREARRRLPRMLYDYVAGGAGEQLTLRRNRADLQALVLRQHTMRDVAGLNTALDLAGFPARLPLVLAPAGLAGLAWPNGECAAARAAARCGVPFCLSTMSVCSIEDVAAASAQPFWFQLYLMKDRGISERLLRRAHDAGCTALVLTLDLHVQGSRWSDVHHGLGLPPRLSPANLADLLGHPRWLLGMAASRRYSLGNLAEEVRKAGGMRQLSAWVASQFDPAFDADTVRWVRQQWQRKLILKGVMHADDARQACALGADGIVVSNHGGRQLDGAPSSISVLPEIAAAVGGRLEVYVDGGLRTGADLLKALGRGARAGLCGRAWVYGLAAGGEDGVVRAIGLLEAGLRESLTLAGERDVRAIAPGVVTAAPAL